MQENKSARPMSFALVALGLCFFFNPYFAVIDLFPDFIGCFFIWLGLSRAARINTAMQEARTAFLKLLALCVGKDIIVMMTFGSSAVGERPVALLSISFVSALLTVWLGYNAFHALYDGFYGLAARAECKMLYGNCKRRGIERSRTEIMLKRTMVFLVLREVMGVLPEFSALSTTIFYLQPGHINMYDYIGVMRTLSFLIVLVGGIFYLTCVLRYFRVVRKEREFRLRLAQRESVYTAAHPGNAVERRYRFAFLLMAIGTFLLTDFYIDFFNVIPDVAGAAFLLAGMLLTDLSRVQKLRCGIGIGAYCVIATLSSHLAYVFATEHSIGEIGKTAEGTRAYRMMWGSALLEMFVFLAMLVLVLLALRCVIDKWTGYVAVQGDSAFEKRRRTAFLEEFDGVLIRTFVFGLIAAVSSFVYDYMKIIPGGKWFRILEFFWAFDFCMSLLFATLFTALLGSILQGIKHRFEYCA